MRDILVVTIVMVGALAALRRPWIGIMLWTWLSIMNPHRYTWGFAYNAPLAAIAAASVILGLLMTERPRVTVQGQSRDVAGGVHGLDDHLVVDGA